MLEAQFVATAADFKQWVRASIRPLLPHKALYSGYGSTHAGGVGLDYVITDDFPLSHLKNIRNKAGGMDSPILRRWIATQQPQFFEVENPWTDVPQTWLEHFRSTGLKNIASHGVFDPGRCVGTYHSFFDVPGPLTDSHVDVLKRVCPIVHEVMCNVIERLEEDRNFKDCLETLTKREQEIANCAGEGKTNREISEIFSISEITVKHHLMKIFDKLNVGTRAQLVSRLAEHRARVPSEFGFKLL